MITILFFILVFASEVVGTISGFGSSVFFIPLAGLFFDFKTTLILTSLMHIFSTSAQLWMFRKEINWSLLFKIGIPSVLFVVLGAYLNDKVDIKYAQMAMGIFLIIFSTAFLIKKNLKFNPTTFNAIVGGMFSGFLAGLIGTGGAIRGATLSAFDLSKGAFVGTSAGIDLGVDISRTIVYLSNGYLAAEYLWYIPMLLILASSGAWVGKKLLNFIPQHIFKKIVLSLIMVVGIYMIYGVVDNTQVIQ